MDSLTALERAVLDKLLAGEFPVLDILRRQIQTGQVIEHRMTGVGFFTKFGLPAGAPRTQGTFQFGDVLATVEGLPHGAGFVLWVQDGVLDLLEGYTFDEPWPQATDRFALEYIDDRKKDLHQLQGGRA